MSERHHEKRWLWITLLLSSVSICAVVYAFWELIENRFFRETDYVALHYLYVSRGIASSLLLAIWAAWYVLHQRRIVEEELRRSRERYRGLLELSPAAVVLYDADLRVVEWNKAAERLYGRPKSAVVGQPLPTLPGGADSELAGLMELVEGGVSVLDQEVLRCDASGATFEVLLSLLPFVEGGTTLFLEVSSDIRERVRLREALLQLEKLTTMGKMAAGTAHHLNTPLASMLLRVQMMEDVCATNRGAQPPSPVQRGEAAPTTSGSLHASPPPAAFSPGPCAATMHDHLSHMEQSIAFCQQFVRRLLDFARTPLAARQPEELRPIVDAVAGFLSPSFTSKRVTLAVDFDSPNPLSILADRNQLETLLLILLSNALDAVSAGGAVRVVCRRGDDGYADLRVIDNGVGIREQDRARVFEPFFTTKPIGKGTGLGLPIAQNIVTEHGGSIELHSEFGAGAELRVRLPLHVAVCNPQEVTA